jgi:hypothetical protein
MYKEYKEFVKGFWDYRPVHDNPEDGHGYWQDDDNKWWMAPKCINYGARLQYDWREVSCVEDMASNGVGEEDIARVQQFINSLEERA